MAAKDEMFFADYSERDREIVDYQFYNFPALPNIGFRGPAIADEILASGHYYTAIGAAQTLGVYVQKPYTELLSEKIGLPGLNLSLGGINPGFFADTPYLLDLANRGRFVILQVMTARTEPNDRIEPVGISLVRDLKTGEVDIPEAVWLRVLHDERDKVPAYIQQNIASWHQAYERLLAKITVPVILFYFSYKSDAETINYDAQTLEEFYGTFPQFVGIDDVKRVATLCDAYAECRSKRDFGHLLLSRFTGEPVEIDFSAVHPSATEKHQRNFYYPSPQMHEDAVPPLLAAIAALNLKD